MLELIGFVFRFEDLCCDYVQHNVLCNESEFSGVCVIQTVGSLVTRQGLICLYIYFHLAHPTLDQMIIHFFVVP